MRYTDLFEDAKYQIELLRRAAQEAMNKVEYAKRSGKDADTIDFLQRKSWDAIGEYENVVRAEKAKSFSTVTGESATPELDEAYGKGWAILPATMALYNKRVVDIVTAASCWENEETTILVCSKEENGRQRLAFISSSGDATNYYKVGQGSETFHDQTGQSKGYYKIENVVVLKGGQILKKANEVGINAKASLSVFK